MPERKKKGKRAVLVTGSSRGIGFAIAEAFMELGYDVALNGRDEKVLAKAVDQLKRINSEAAIEPISADVTMPKGVSRLFKIVSDKFGHLDVLVNNVGNFVLARLFEHSEKEMDDMVESNMLAPFFVTKKLLPLLRLSKSGRIINIAAAYASSGKVMPEFSIYAMAKIALVSLTKSMAVELAPEGIIVNVVSPGLIDTGVYNKKTIDRLSKFVPMGRFGAPDEVAAAVVFLASSQASYITGSEIIVGGGWDGETTSRN